MDNDLNSSGAFAAIFELTGKVNPALEEGRLSSGDAKQVFDLMLKFDTVLSIFTPKEKVELSGEIEALIGEREKARKRKDFKLADEIRRKLEDLGIVLEDTKEGTRWMKK